MESTAVIPESHSHEHKNENENENEKQNELPSATNNHDSQTTHNGSNQQHEHSQLEHADENPPASTSTDDQPMKVESATSTATSSASATDPGSNAVGTTNEQVNTTSVVNDPQNNPQIKEENENVAEEKGSQPKGEETKHHHHHSSSSRHTSSRHRDDSSRRHSSRRDRDRDRERENDRYHRKSRSRSRGSRSSHHRASRYRDRDGERHQSPSYDRHHPHSHSSSRHREKDRDRDRYHRRSRHSNHRSRDRRDRERSHHRSKEDLYRRDRDSHRDRERQVVGSRDERDTIMKHNHHHHQPSTMPSTATTTRTAMEVDTNMPSHNGASMMIKVQVYPTSSPADSQSIDVSVCRTSTVSDFKGTLCTKGFNVFLQYDLLVGDKKLDVEDDRLLCVHVGIKPDSNTPIVVRPKADNDPTKKPVSDEYNPFLAASTNHNADGTVNNNNNNHHHNTNNAAAAAAAAAMHNMLSNANNSDAIKSRADQIVMYEAYEEMFGVEEAAGMMGLDAEQVKKLGIEQILINMEEEKEKERRQQQLDQEAAEAARSTDSHRLANAAAAGDPHSATTGPNGDGANSAHAPNAASNQSGSTGSFMNGLNNPQFNKGINPALMSANQYYSDEMLFAQAMQAAAFNNNVAAAHLAAAGGTLPINPTVAAAQLHGATYNGIPTNENLIDFDTAPGTTHTAGGGTVSRPPPPHVSENACIFVGDLHPMVTRSDLLSVFSQIGQVQWIQLFDCHKQMNRPFNFAFVYFEDLLCARKAITTLNYTKFYGAPCRLMWKQEKNSVQWTDCNIIVKNLPPNTDSQVLHAVFSKFGKIISSKVKTTATGRTLPYGYVQYASKEGAERAIIASDKGALSVNGHLLTAEWFKSREDRAFRQIYVKNIPTSWTDDDLLQLFEAQTLGKIKSFTVKHSPYGRWACISFHEPHHAVKAIEKLNNCPTGDVQSPNLSVSRFMYKTERDKFKTIKKCDVEQCYSIYVGNVPLQLTDEHMRQLFEPFGAVISAAVVQKTEDYKYGFVNFEQPEDAARALVTMNGKSIGGKTLQVKPANTDMSKAIAISQAADYVSTIRPSPQQQQQHRQQQQHSTVYQQQQQQQQGMNVMNVPPVNNDNHNQQQSNDHQEPISAQQAKQILRVEDEKKEKVWKVQYGDDWHEYDTTLAAIVEQLSIAEQIQITLADSNYIITRLSETEAMQKNCASGTMRKVLRSIRDL